MEVDGLLVYQSSVVVILYSGCVKRYVCFHFQNVAITHLYYHTLIYIYIIRLISC